MNTVRHILQVKGYDIWTISPDASVFDALRMMADKDVGALLVVDGEKLVGIITERDYSRKIILEGKASKDTSVREAMTDKVWSIHPDQTVQECMTVMHKRKIRYVPVLEEGKVIGVISIGDVVNDIIYQQKKSISSLEDRLLRRNVA